ncbi:MAG: hypothetical protein ACMXYD_02630 [Candidatus Woesearchaeota archaeon]
MKLKILDFDGLLTDINKEAQPIIQGFLRELYADIGLTKKQGEQAFRNFNEQLGVEDAWHFHGHDTVRWDADPYIQASTAASKLYKHYREELDETTRSNNLSTWFRKHQQEQQNKKVFWREDVKYFLNTLLEETNPVIVTNSKTLLVQKKIRSLGLNKNLPVYGKANKYEIDDTHTELPEHMNIEGMSRPILLRRKHYYEIIKQLIPEGEQAIFAGDIYEFDLALPEHLGHKTILAFSQGNDAYEKRHTQKNPQGKTANSLLEALEYIR